MWNIRVKSYQQDRNVYLRDTKQIRLGGKNPGKNGLNVQKPRHKRVPREVRRNYW